jgi:predicted RNase H-like HicB family nuclease
MRQGVQTMNGMIVELIPDPEQGGFTARIPDIPAYGEGETEEEAIADLKEALRGYIEAFGLDDARARIASPSIRRIDWDLAELARD